jgi:hypothetical protein
LVRVREGSVDWLWSIYFMKFSSNKLPYEKQTDVYKRIATSFSVKTTTSRSITTFYTGDATNKRPNTNTNGLREKETKVRKQEENSRTTVD